MELTVTVRPATPGDAAAVAAIYNHYVTHTIVTFEEVEVSAEEMAGRMHEVLSASMPWLIAELDGRVVGYAYAGKWKGRIGYRFSTEITVYLDPKQGKRGIGSRLYGALFPILKDKGIHAVFGGIGLPNEGSVALHEKFGMEKVAHFKEQGRKFDKWIDVGYWQRLL